MLPAMEEESSKRSGQFWLNVGLTVGSFQPYRHSNIEPELSTTFTTEETSRRKRGACAFSTKN